MTQRFPFGVVMVVAVALSAACSGSSSPGTAPARTTAGSPGGIAPTPSAPAPLRLQIRTVARLPFASSRAVAVRDGNHVLVLGGLTTGDVTTARVVAVNLPSGRATTVGALPEAVHDASGAALGSRAVVFGGGAAQEVSDVQAWAAGRGHVVGRLPIGRSDSAAAVIDGTAYVVGGFDGAHLTRDILATADGRTFRVAGRLRRGVRYPAVTAAAGSVWVVGGQLATTPSTSTGGQTSDIQRFDPSTGRTTVVGHLPHPLGHAMAFTLGGRVFVAGGRVGTRAVARIWRLDLGTGRAIAAGRLPRACSDAATVMVGDRAWLVGGETSGPLTPLRTVLAVGQR